MRSPVVTRHGAKTALTATASATETHIPRRMRRSVAAGSSAPSLSAGSSLSTIALITERKILHAARAPCRARRLLSARHDAYALVEADGRAEQDTADEAPRPRAGLAVEQPAEAEERG